MYGQSTFAANHQVYSALHKTDIDPDIDPRYTLNATFAGTRDEESVTTCVVSA